MSYLDRFPGRRSPDYKPPQRATRSPSYEASGWSVRIRSRSPLSRRPLKAPAYPLEHEEIQRTSLPEQQRRRDKKVCDKARIYENDFWIKQKQKPRVLRPEQERFLDTTRLDNVPAKYDHNNYDYGQFKFKKEENYCDKCDVLTKTRDHMQAHKEGAVHKKMSAKVQRYRCKLCLVEVPCQDTLDNHMRGKDHLKREKQLQDQRKEQGYIMDEGYLGFKTGPREMEKLEHTEREELDELRKTVKILQAMVQEQSKKLVFCKQKHGRDNMEDLREKNKCLQEEIKRLQELVKPSIFCKKELGSVASNSSRFKNDSKYQSQVFDREGEYVEEQKDSKI